MFRALLWSKKEHGFDALRLKINSVYGSVTTLVEFKTHIVTYYIQRRYKNEIKVYALMKIRTRHPLFSNICGVYVKFHHVSIILNFYFFHLLFS